MSSASLFQRLPKPILELIAHYTMYLKSGDEYSHMASPVSLYAHRADLFYSLCPEWTEVALEHYFRSFVLRLNSSSGAITASHSYEKLGISIKDACKAIKGVKLIMGLSDLMRGKAALVLALSKYSFEVFPAVRKLTIVFDMNCINNYALELSDSASVPSCYQKLLQMFPNVLSIGIEKLAGDHVSDVSTQCEFEKFMMKVHEKYYHMRVDLSHHRDMPWSTTNIHSTITYICLFNEKFSAKTYALLHKSAGSLQSLRVVTYKRINAICFFTDAKGNSVTYHSLKVLRLFNMRSGPASDSYSDPIKLMVPRLAHIAVKGGYPFRDDVLFRSCSKTLEYVSLSTDPSTMSVLNQFHVFRGRNYPNLSGIGMLNKEEKASMVEFPGYFKFVSSIAHNLKMLTVEDEATSDKFVNGIIQGPSIHSIQYLSMEKANLSFTSLCQVIKKLPWMTQLRFDLLSLGDEYQGLAKTDLYNQVTSRWPLLSNSLEYCHVFHRGADLLVDNLAICGILLSLMCPKFTRLVIDESAYTQFNETVSGIISEEPYSSHAKRLGRLVYNQPDVGNFPRAS